MIEEEHTQSQQNDDSRSSFAHKTAGLAPLTRLIGRAGECQALSPLLLHQTARLLTLTGPGGVGKTRLALALSYDLREAYRDGVQVVHLSAIRTPELLLPTIAEALGIQSGSRPILEILAVSLHNKHLLLLLDNFEQIIQAAPSLSALLSTCPNLTLLVTSREPLYVQGEYVFGVTPLAVPDLSQANEVTHLLANPSVALFVERAHAIQPGFRLTEANAHAVAQICVHLEGLPLSLELAAARITLLPPRALLSRLTPRLSLLTRGRRDAPSRQQTLRNTIQWSYDLLDPSEQTLFRRLCLFVGGGTLDAFEGLYQELGDDPKGMLDSLTYLLDKSLIQREELEGDDPRFLMLETIREFGLEALEASGEQKQVASAQTRYYLRWASMGKAALFGREQQTWIRRFVQEQGNVRTVMDFVIAQHDQEAALSLGALLGTFWVFLGTSSHHHYLVEGIAFLEQALAGSEPVITSERGWALAIYGELLAMRGESGQGESICEQGLTMCRQVDDIQGCIGSLWMLEDVYQLRGDYRAGRRVLEEAVTLSQRLPERCTVWGGSWTLGFSLHRSGHVALWEGRYQQAKDLLLEGSTLCHQQGDVYVALLSQLYLGEVACFEGKIDEARTALEQSIETFRAWNMHMYLSEALGFLGLLAISTGKLDEAHTLLSEGLHLAKATGDELRQQWFSIWFARISLVQQDFREARRQLSENLPHVIKIHPLPAAIGLETLGAVVTKQGEPKWAAQLCGCAEVLRELMGTPIPPLERIAYKELVSEVRRTLGEKGFHAAWTEGRGMQPEQVLRLQEHPTTITQAPEGAGNVIRLPPQVRALGLTRRELEVLRLLAEGLTNAQIAERLVLSIVTVNSYLRSIYSKLGVSSRTQAIRLGYQEHLLIFMKR
jgi:predicted ATPase/DNA-binding CsgD family transcriptional regulator